MGDSVIYQNLQDEVVILNMTSQQYYGLDAVGAAMWKMLLDESSVAAVVDRMSAEYEVEAEIVQRDLEELVQRLIESGLLKKAQV